MKSIKNQSGFTLVELLAVVTVLVIIMGIAALSMNGVIGNVRVNSMKSSASYFIDGTRKLLLANMELGEGTYYLSDSMLEKKVSSPWGKYLYYKGDDQNIATELKTKGYYKVSDTKDALDCGGDGKTGSFMSVAKDTTSGNYNYVVCLYDDANHYIYASETVLTSDSANRSDFYRENNTAKLTLDSTGKIASN